MWRMDVALIRGPGPPPPRQMDGRRRRARNLEGTSELTALLPVRPSVRSLSPSLLPSAALAVEVPSSPVVVAAAAAAALGVREILEPS